MIKLILDSLVLLFMATASIVHLFRLIYLIFQFEFLKKWNFISNMTPSKTNLALYYLLTILAGLYGASMKWDAITK